MFRISASAKNRCGCDIRIRCPHFVAGADPGGGGSTGAAPPPCKIFYALKNFFVHGNSPKKNFYSLILDSDPPYENPGSATALLDADVTRYADFVYRENENY